MDQTTLLIIGAAVLVLGVVLFLLARTGRKPPEGPIVDTTAPEPLPEPVAPAPAPAPVTQGPPDELTRLKGLGPKASAILNGLGYTRYDQIAAWSEADIATVDAHMGAFKGRIVRDRWVEQAAFLAAGDTAGFEEKFGKLG